MSTECPDENEGPQTSASLAMHHPGGAAATNWSVTRWVISCLILTVIVAVVALAMPGRFRFHGLFNAAIGVAVGAGSRWLFGHLPRRSHSAVSPRFPAFVAFVVVLALVAQVAVSAGDWLQYRALVHQTWQRHPTTMITARLLEGQIATTESNGQQQLNQMQQLFNENEKQRREALKTRSGLSTWIVKRVDNRLRLHSLTMATGFWFGEICLGCLAALFGFVRPAAANSSD